MYNQIPTYRGGYSKSNDVHASIDTSHFLTIPKGNQLYVNETGDDSKNGILDMKNNKIVNLANPDRNNDVSNKFYVDDSIIKATKNYGVIIKEIEDQRGKLEKLETAIKNLKNETELQMKSIELLNQGDIKKLADFQAELVKLTKEQKQINKNIHDDFIRINDSIFNLPKQYSFLLDIGIHLGFPVDGKTESLGKVTSHEIIFPFNILEDRLNLQHTLITHTSDWKDDLSSHIRTVKIDKTIKDERNERVIESTKLTIELYTFRSNGTHHWGLHLHSYLLVTIFKDNILTIKNKLK